MVDHAPASTTTTATTTTATSTGASPTTAVAANPAVTAALAGVPAGWRAAFPTLFAEVATPPAGTPPAQFGDRVYRWLADSETAIDTASASTVLGATPGVADYARALDEAKTQLEADAALKTRINEDITDLCAGGDVPFNSRRIMGNHAALSLRGKAWFRESDRATAFCLGRFDEYCQGDTLTTHAARGLSMFGDSFAETVAERRRTPCTSLYNLLRSGRLSSDAPAATADATTPTEGEGRDVNRAGAHGTVEEEQQWDEQAETLKGQVRAVAPRASSRASRTATPDAITAREFSTLLEQIYAAPVPVRERVFADVAIMRLITESGTTTQVASLMRALDPIEDLYDQCCATGEGAGTTTAGVGTDERGTAVPRPSGTPYQLISSWLLQHPGTENRERRMRVLQHTRLKDDFIDSQSEENRRILYRIVARGTDQPSAEDQVQAACAGGDGVGVVRGLMALSNEDPTRLRELQDDQIFYSAVARMTTEVTVEGIAIVPYHYALTIWGRPVGATADVLVGEMQATGGPVGEELRPLSVEERQQLDIHVFDDPIRIIRDEADDTYMSDSNVMSALRTFQTNSANPTYRDLIRRMGQAPGPALASKYNASGRSLNNDLRSGLDEENAREAERIIGAAIDSASVGTLGGTVTLATDAMHAEPGNVPLEQALRETLHGTEPVTAIIHRAATDLYHELTDFWNIISESDLRGYVQPCIDAVTGEMDGLIRATGLTGRIFWEELLKNAFTEIGGSLTEMINAKFSGTELTNVCAFLRIGRTYDAEREAARAAATGEAAPDHSADLSRDAFAGKAQELFRAITALTSFSEQTAFTDIGRLRREGRALQLGASPWADALAAVLPRPAAADPAAPAAATETGAPQTFEAFYRQEYGVDAEQHAVLAARALLHPAAGPNGTPASTSLTPDSLATAMGFDVARLSGALPPPSDNTMTAISGDDLRAVRPDFTIETAQHNAREIWRIFHEGGQVQLISTVLYGVYNDTEQRYIRSAFRALSGGPDIHFYIAQAQEQLRTGRSIGSGSSSVGAEGTAEGAEVATGAIRITGDPSDLEAALSVTTTGEIDARARVSTAVSNGDMNQLFRVVEDLDDAGRRQVLGDAPLMARLRAACDEVNYDRVYRGLMGTSTLRTRLESRAHGSQAWWGVFDGTDEDGMREDIQAYIRQVRRQCEEQIREEFRTRTPRPTAEQTAQEVERRVRDACRDMLANPDIEQLLRDEMSGYDLSRTTGVMFNAGEENAAAAVLRDGDWSEDEAEILTSIRGMSYAERQRRLADPEFMRRLGDLVDDEDDYRDAMAALTAGDTPAGGTDHLGALDTASRSEHEVSGDMSRDEDAILDNLSQLTPDEYRRLMNDPRMMAQILNGLDDNPSELARARRLMAFRFEEIGESVAGMRILGENEAPSGDALSRAEAERLAFLKFNAIERIHAALPRTWNVLLENCVEVFRMDLSPNLPEGATPPTADGVAAAHGVSPDEAAPRGPRDPHEVVLRNEIWADVGDDVQRFCDRESSTTEVASDSMQTIVENAVKGVRDPSSARISDRLGAFNDDDDAITATLRAASDDVLIEEWTTVTQRSQSGGDSFRMVYERYKAARDAETAAAAGSDALVVSPNPDGTAAVTDPATGTTETRPASPPTGDAAAAPTPDETGAPAADAGAAPVVDDTPGTPAPTMSPELERARLAFMDYVIDISMSFESMLGGHAGGVFSEGDRSSAAVGRSSLPVTSVDDNSQWHEWCDILRERIPNLDVAKVATAIGATDPADRDLINNPNRTARTSLAFRTHRYLRQRGEHTGSGLGVAHDEAESLDAAMVGYGRALAVAETNSTAVGGDRDTDGYGVITDAEGNSIEARYGHEFDRALEAYRGAKAAIADWAAIVVGLLITAVITILTAGTATGPAMMILIGAITSAAAATGQALTREAIMGTDYEFSREGLQSIGSAVITGIISAGAAHYAQGLLAGLAGLPSLGAQATAASAVLARQPGVWTQLGLQVAEEGLSTTFEGGTNALLAAIDPNNFVDGFSEGMRRASHRVESEVAAIPGSVLQAGVTTILSFGMGRLRGGGGGGDDPMEALARETGTINVRRNFHAYFGDQAGTMTEAFAGWLVEQGMTGRFPNLEDVPASLVRAYLQELTEKGTELHSATAHHGSRGARADEDLDSNGHLLHNDDERAAFRDMATGAGETDPYVSISDFVAARQQAITAALADVPNVTATERAAFEAHCRSAPDAETFRARVEGATSFLVDYAAAHPNPPAVVVTPTIVVPGTTADPSASADSTVDPNAADPSVVVVPPPIVVAGTTTSDPAASASTDPASTVSDPASTEPTSTDPAVSEPVADTSVVVAPVIPDGDTPPVETARDEMLGEDESRETDADDVATQVVASPTVVVTPTVAVGDESARVEAVRGDVIMYVQGFLETVPLDGRRAFLAWLRSPDGEQFCRSIAIDQNLTGPQRAAAARERAADVVDDWRAAGGGPVDETGSPATGLMSDRESRPGETPAGAISDAERPMLFDAAGRSPADVVASFAALPWNDPVNLMPGRLKYEYAEYLCTPPHSGKLDGAAWRAQRTEEDQLQLTLLAPTLTAAHVDALRATFPRLAADVPEGGPISSDALARIFAEFVRAGDFASAGNDVDGFARHIDRLASEGIGGLTGPAGMIVTDRDVSDPAVAPNRAFGFRANSQQYICDPLVVAGMTPEQYSVEIGIINNSALWPIASERLRDLVGMFGETEGRREWISWVNANGGFKPLTHLNVVWNGAVLQGLLHYRGEHAMAGLSEQVTDQIPLDSPIFTAQLLGIAIVPGEPIGTTLERRLREILVTSGFGRTEAEVATADLATMLAWAQVAHDQSVTAPRTAPVTEGAADTSVMTSHAETVEGSSFTGDARAEAAPDALRAQLAPAAASVAAMFDGVMYDGGNQLSIRVGERVATVALSVVPSSTTEGTPANVMYDRTTDDAVIDISDRVQDAHVERAIAHGVGQILSEMQAAAGVATRADTGTGLGAAGDGAMLSHDDLGHLAEVRVLIAQLDAARAPASGDPDATAVLQLQNELRRLLDVMGLRGEGAEVATRRRAAEAHLGGVSLATVNTSIDVAVAPIVSITDTTVEPVSTESTESETSEAPTEVVVDAPARTRDAIAAATANTVALPPGTTAASTAEGTLVTLPIAGGDPVAVTIVTTPPPAPGTMVAVRPASHVMGRDGTATITVSEGASPDHIERAVAQQLAEIAFTASELARGVRTDTTSALVEGSQATSADGLTLSSRDAGNIAQLRVMGEQLRAARAAGNTELAGRLSGEVTGLLLQMGLLEGDVAGADDLAANGRTTGADAVAARMGLIRQHLAAQGLDVAEIQALIDQNGDAPAIAAARERQAVARAELRAAIERARTERRARDAEVTAAVGAAIAGGAPVVLDRIIVGGGWSAVCHFVNLGAPAHAGGGVPSVMAIAMGDDPWSGRGEMLMGQNASELEVPGFGVQPQDLADDPHAFVPSSAFSGAVEANRADSGMPTMGAAVARVEERPDTGVDDATWPPGTVRITLDDGRMIFAHAVSIVSGPGLARAPTDRTGAALVSQQGGLTRDRIVDPDSGFRVDSAGQFFDRSDAPVARDAVPPEVQARLGWTDAGFVDPRHRVDTESGYRVNVATREMIDPSGAVVDPASIDPTVVARLEALMGPRRATFGGDMTSADFDAASGGRDYNVLVYGAGASGSWDVEQAHGSEHAEIDWAARIAPSHPAYARCQELLAIPEADRTDAERAELDAIRESVFSGGNNRRNRLPGVGAHDPGVRADLNDMPIAAVVDMMPTPDGRIFVVFSDGTTRVYDHVVSSIGQDANAAHGVNAMLGGTDAPDLRSMRGAGNEVIGAETESGQITVLGAAAVQATVDDPDHRARLEAQGRIQGDSSGVTVGIRPIAGRLADASDRMRAEGDAAVDTAVDDTTLDATGTASAVPGSSFHGRSSEVDLTDAQLDEALAAAVATFGDRVTLSGRTLVVQATLPDGSPTTITLTIASGGLRTSAVAQHTFAVGQTAATVTVSNRATAEDAQRGLAHEVAEILAIASGAPTTANALAVGSTATALSAHDQGRLAEVGVLAGMIDAATDAEERAALVREMSALLAHLGMLGNVASDSRLSALISPETQALIARMQQVVAGLPMVTSLLGNLEASAQSEGAAHGRTHNPEARQQLRAALVTQLADLGITGDPMDSPEAIALLGPVLARRISVMLYVTSTDFQSVTPSAGLGGLTVHGTDTRLGSDGTPVTGDPGHIMMTEVGNGTLNAPQGEHLSFAPLSRDTSGEQRAELDQLGIQTNPALHGRTEVGPFEGSDRIATSTMAGMFLEPESDHYVEPGRDQHYSHEFHPEFLSPEQFTQFMNAMRAIQDENPEQMNYTLATINTEQGLGPIDNPVRMVIPFGDMDDIREIAATKGWRVTTDEFGNPVVLCRRDQIDAVLAEWSHASENTDPAPQRTVNTAEDGSVQARNCGTELLRALMAMTTSDGQPVLDESDLAALGMVDGVFQEGDDVRPQEIYQYLRWKEARWRRDRGNQ